MSKIGQHIIENEIDIPVYDEPAFPSGHNPMTGTMTFGMTLRDYFAIHCFIKENNAELAYKQADELLRERKK
jgi:hypothetical protein